MTDSPVYARACNLRHAFTHSQFRSSLAESRLHNSIVSPTKRVAMREELPVPVMKDLPTLEAAFPCFDR